MSESLDKNKTALTHRVTATAAAYLDGLGCKPVETEVPIRSDWIADVASYWYPTVTEAKRIDLDKRAKEMLGDSLCDYPIDRNYGAGPYTVLVEVKTTPADFKQDTKDWTEYLAHFCFIAYPTGVLSTDEIPKGWYGIQTSKNGTSVSRVHHSFHCYYPHPQFIGPIVDFIAAVGIRRDHRTRNAAMRDWLKSYRATDAENRKQYSAARLLDCLANWLRNKDLEADRDIRHVLATCGIKNPPKYCQPAIEFFESLKRGER